MLSPSPRACVHDTRCAQEPSLLGDVHFVHLARARTRFHPGFSQAIEHPLKYLHADLLFSSPGKGPKRPEMQTFGGGVLVHRRTDLNRTSESQECGAHRTTTHYSTLR